VSLVILISSSLPLSILDVLRPCSSGVVVFAGLWLETLISVAVFTALNFFYLVSVNLKCITSLGFTVNVHCDSSSIGQARLQPTEDHIHHCQHHHCQHHHGTIFLQRVIVILAFARVIAYCTFMHDCTDDQSPSFSVLPGGILDMSPLWRSNPPPSSEPSWHALTSFSPFSLVSS